MKLVLAVASVSRYVYQAAQHHTILRYIDVLQEQLSTKRKEMYWSVQIKAGVSQPTQLLIDMKVWWSSMYIMLNHAEMNKEVHILYCHTFTYQSLLLAIAC
jgi:hypothetical protein